MTPSASPHLSDEQLAECLADAPPVAAEQHLAACPLCREELSLLRSSLADFNQLSLSWAARRAPARILVPSRAALRWQRIPAWSAAAAALAASVILATHTGLHHPQRTTSAAASPLATTPATIQIADSSTEDDDHLLLAVDSEIQAGRQSPVSASELGLAGKSTASSSAQGLDN